MNTACVCSHSGTPGAATSDSIVTAAVSGGGEGFGSGAAGLAGFGAGSETCGAEFTSNFGVLKTGTFGEGLDPGGASAARGGGPTGA